ncbi:MAG TPA: indole-3-glycerol phosphate synthase TrpC [Bryobacteraceae bacterium]|nr:indole-3-glycerol phosphate synthase TrpC [Bryobacteraceae bacterium]
MVHAIPDILAQIAENKRKEMVRLLAKRRALEAAAEAAIAGRRDFQRAMEAGNPSVIAEIKQASPSKGILSLDFDPVRTALEYQSGGAAALSVLTDEVFFKGSLKHLEAARSSVRLPALRKDFTIDELHVIEAAAHEADAVLLIAALLSEAQLRSFRELAEQYRMAAVVEVHDEAELDQALGSGARIVGVNNRDLRTFEVTLDTSLKLAQSMPPGVIAVAESGIHSRADIDRLRSAGYRGFLVGEYLMKSPDPAAALRELTGCS